MNLDNAIKYWKQRLTDGKSINRVRVRRILAMEGAERRGFAIMRRISDKFEVNGLKTVPDFQSVWIDALVAIKLSNEDTDSISLTVGDNLPSGDLNNSLTDDIEQGIDPVDFSEEEESTADKSVAPVAEVLNSPAGDAGVIEVTVAPPIDAVIRISSVPSANRGVVSVLPTEPLSMATTLMSFEGYSQLAIMQGQREVRGMITWESIAKHSMLSSKPSTVADCRIDAQVIDADASLFDALPTIETYGYVLARSKNKIITGIVTATDFAAELSTLSYAFMCLRTIEMLIRNKLHPKVTPSDLANLEVHSKARSESDPGLLTFGENIRLLEREEVWNRLELAIHKTEFLKRLLEIRDVRNEVMHFGPDPLDSEQKKNLNQMEHFLRQVFV